MRNNNLQLPMDNVGETLPKEYLMQSVENIYNYGLPHGLETGIKELDKLVRLDTGRLCVVTGIPNDGKSEFVDFLVTRYNKTKGYKAYYFSPENQPVSYHLSKLVSKYTNKPFCNACISKDELKNTASYISNNFFIANYEKVKTSSQILSNCKEAIDEHDVKILVIDAFNKIESEVGDGDSLVFISRFLDTLCSFAIKENILIFLVAHPRKMDWSTDGNRRPIPNPYDINGSANFFNKSDFIMTVQRNRRNNDDTSVTIRVGKCKFANYGKQGQIELNYDRDSGNYYYDNSCDIDFLDDEEQKGYTPIPFDVPAVEQENEPLDVEVSIYEGATDNTGEKGSLKEFLITDKYKEIANAIRKGMTPEERHELKGQYKGSIPCATIAGTFSKRSKEGLLSSSGLMCIDIDGKDNKDIMGQVPEILKRLDYVTFFAKSISGDGYFAIVRIDNPKHYINHFRAIEAEMKTYGITLDKSCKDCSRLRFATYDENAYYNKESSIYYNEIEDTKQSVTEILPNTKFTSTFTESTCKALDKRISFIKNHNITINDDYNTWFNLGMSLSALGEQGRHYFHTISALSNKYDIYECDSQYDEILERYKGNNDFTIGTAIHILDEACQSTGK